ncbi:hypothetical protein G6F54_014419 [Rhizopus delemar]|nr:hypothetical protein G6F54_014419 [Rhizopus delemar]
MRLGRLQHGLGQGRALVGGMRFAADQRDRAFMALVAQGGGGHRAGLAGADDEDRVGVSHDQPCTSA